MWTVFFMKKLVQFTALVLLLGLMVWYVGVLKDRQLLSDGLIRLHVVAASDSPQDQEVKLQVRDAITAWLEPVLDELPDQAQAEAYLRDRLADLEALTNQILSKLGCGQTARVSLEREAFPLRTYDTFRLPAGVYTALRVVIGPGEGHNWWCVVFPGLCLPQTQEAFREKAASAGFSQTLSGALTGEGTYQLRFFLLDWLGRLDNFFFSGK